MKVGTGKYPVGDTYYGDFAETYLQERASTERWSAEHETVSQVLSTFPEGLTVLDVPLGTGRFLPIYVGRQATVTGIDASVQMLRLAKEQAAGRAADVNFRLGDARKLPFDETSFDLLVCFRFLQNIVSLRDVRRCLSEFRRVARHCLLEFEVRNDDATEDIYPSEDEPLNDTLTDAQIAQLLTLRGLVIIQRIEIMRRGRMSYRAYLCRPANE